MSKPEPRKDLNAPPYDGCSFYEAKSIHNFGDEIIIAQDHMGNEFELKPKGTHVDPSRPQKIEIFQGSTLCAPVKHYAHATENPMNHMDVVRMTVPYSQIKSRQGVYVKELNLIFYTVADRGDIHHPYINSDAGAQNAGGVRRMVRSEIGLLSTSESNEPHLNTNQLCDDKSIITISANDKTGQLRYVYVAINNSFIINKGHIILWW